MVRRRVRSEKPSRPYGEKFRSFWHQFFSDLISNTKYAWPVLLVFVGWVLLSSLLLLLAEGTQYYGDAVFYTFMAVFGEGISPSSVGGKILYVADALSGYVLLGFVLWFILHSAE